MGKIIACCGLNCSECPLYVAHQTNDYHLMEEIAEALYKLYGLSVKPSETHCTGCTEAEGVYYGCARCPRRQCSIEKNVKSCKSCEEYPCELYEHFDFKDTYAYKNRITQNKEHH